MAQSGANGSKTRPPYIPFKTVDNFLARLKVGVPGRIDNSLMGTMSGTARGHLITALRYLGLISENNITTETLKRLVSAEGGDRQAAWREILTQAYPFLFPPDFDLASATVRQLDEQFQQRGATGDTVRKCSAFFTQAAKAADVTLSPYIAEVKPGSRPARPSATRAKQETPPGSEKDGQDEGGGEPEGEESTHIHRRAGRQWDQLLLEKFPAFDPGWEKDVQLEWFKAFAELRKVRE